MVVGAGAREHAIAHALRRSPSVDDLFATPGNPGIGDVADLLDVAADDIQSSLWRRRPVISKSI
jgi:phosphoribosylamine--glycine ligase